ncbi:MAG: hypothetical protein ABI876_08395, partial [Bacteroidota bacterium]
ITADIINGSVSTGKVADDAITFDKVQNISTGRVLGRSTAGAGNVEEITIGTGLALSGGTLSVTIGAFFLGPVIGTPIFIADSTTMYFGPFKFGTSSSEPQQKYVLPIAVTLSRFSIRLLGANQPPSGNLVFTVRKNGVDTGLQIIVPAGSAVGNFIDTTHTVVFAAGDEFSISATNNATDASANIVSVSVVAQAS